MIDKLTPEQEALIPVYREKWEKLVFSTEPIDRQKAVEMVKLAYNLMGKQIPEIVFLDSPRSVFVSIFSRPIKNPLAEQLNIEIPIRIKIKLGSQIETNLWKIINNNLGQKFNQGFIRFLYNQLIAQFHLELMKYTMIPEGSIYYRSSYLLVGDWIYDASVFDYCNSVLNCRKIHNLLDIYNLIIQNCGLIVPYEEVCFVCDRPRKLSFDTQQRLHAEGEPAVQYADGYSLYSYHGVTLPEKYGKVHPQHWQSQWLLEEDNAELRRVLIQGIGYDRLCQELQAIELDNWKEYILLKIDSEIDIEPIYLLKMNCPSTGFIHALRVPPNLTAREAIAWVNWDIDPEDFSIQT